LIAEKRAASDYTKYRKHAAFANTVFCQLQYLSGITVNAGQHRLTELLTTSMPNSFSRACALSNYGKRVSLPLTTSAGNEDQINNASGE